MSGEDQEELTLKSFEELSYFDNLALFYLCNETPPQTLALAFLVGDKKVCGSMLGVMDAKRRAFVHELMSKQNDVPEDKKHAAAQGLLIIADGLIQRNLIRRQGKFYFGTERA